MRGTGWMGGLFALCACASAATPSTQPARPVQARALSPVLVASEPMTIASANERHTSASGVSFEVPAGWRLRTHGALQRMEWPEAELTLAIFESAAANADAAVSEAWSALLPGFSRSVQTAGDATREGWAHARNYLFTSAADEHRLATALVLSNATTGPFTVVLMHADQASFERRLSDVEHVHASVWPPGYQPESFAGRVANVLDAARVRALTDFVERARTRARIPGAPLALVQDGAIAFEGGFGVRELGKPALVGPQTLFLIASTTKPLTTLLLARLVDEGRFDWHTPVKSVYPAFALATPELTARVQMRHLACACTGVPSQNLEWLFELDHATPGSLLQLLSTMQPTTGFGETFQYSNVMAAAAGFVAGHLLYPERELGAAYDRAMQRLVFGPLAMTDTTLDFMRAQRGNHASPHTLDVYARQSVATMQMNLACVPMRPASGAWSSARDLSRYVRFELARGLLPDGRRHISAEAIAVRYQPNVAIDRDTGAGLGLDIATKGGIRVVSTGGIMPGFFSHLVWLPEHGVGAVLLTNADSGMALKASFQRKLLEVLFDARPKADAALAADVDGFHSWVADELAHWSAQPDAAVVASLARHYRNGVLGELEVRKQRGATIFDFGGWRSRIASRKNADASTTLSTIEPGIFGFEFLVAERAGKRALVVGDRQHEYVFIEAE